MTFDAHGDAEELQAYKEGWEDIFPTPFIVTCDECLGEAWERMTYGGVKIHSNSPLFVEYFQAYVERSTWPPGKSFAVFAREIWEHLQYVTR